MSSDVASRELVRTVTSSTNASLSGVRRATHRVADVGVHTRRHEHADADPGALELVAQRLRQPDDRVLRRAIRSEARRGDEARTRPGVDDVSLALVDHARDEAADAVGDAVDV